MRTLSVFILAAVVLVGVMVAPVMSVFDEDYPEDEIPDCVDKLNPCGPFANSTTMTPSEDCCKPLKVTLENDLGCLCSIFASPDVIRSLDLNVSEALTLPNRCGVDLDLVKLCDALAKVPAIAPLPPKSEPTQNDARRRIARYRIVFGPLLLLATLLFD